MTLPPPFPPAREESTEPGLGAMALRMEVARLLQENGRLRRERNEARTLAAEAPSIPPPPTRGRKVAIMGTAATAGGALFLVARLILRFVAEQWPELAPLCEGLLGVLGGL